MNPRGGTELQVELLHKYADKDLLDKVQITTSVPEKYHYIQLNQIYFGNKIHMTRQILRLGFKIKIIIKSMIGMYLTHIGVMRNLE